MFAILIQPAIAQGSAKPDSLSTVRITNQAPIRAANEQFVALVDDSAQLTLPNVLALPSDRFQPLPEQRIDFGFTPAQIWLRLKLHNERSDSGEFRLVLHTRFMQTIEAHLVRKGGIETILSNSAASRFDEREVANRLLVAPFRLAQNEAVELVVQYQAGGSSALPISIETPTSFLEFDAQTQQRHFAMGAAGIAIILLTVLSMGVMRWSVRIFYGFYFAATLLYLAHMMGYTFQYLWPNAPGWNAFASIFLGYIMNIAAALFTREFLDVKKHNPMLNRLLSFTIALTCVVIVVGWLGPASWVKEVGFPYTSLCLILFFCIGIVAWRRKHPGAGFFVVAWSGLALVGLLASVAHSVPGIIDVHRSFDFISYGALFEASMFSLAINAQAHRLRRETAVSLERELAATQAQLAAEQERGAALQLAEERREQLATASHDIKQPLLSLRYALKKIDTEDKKAAEILDGFDYLEDLLSRFLADSRPDSTPADPKDRPLNLEAAKSVSAAQVNVGQIINHLKTMFQEEAHAKGLQLRVQHSSADVHAEPIIVMRILSNLLANAIRYTERGKVLVGARRRPTGVELYVCDTGCGMTQLQLNQAMKPYVRGDTSDGTGLGLAICVQLANQEGMQLSAQSQEDKGTCFKLFVPFA